MRDDLVYDIGLHKGEDTAYYLAKGFRVVAFDANPDLVAGARERFAPAIAEGRVTLVEGAIADSDQDTITFHRHPSQTEWGTIDPDWALRNEQSNLRASERIDVPVINLARIIERDGVPFYAKIDIEGADRLCLQTLGNAEERPAYVSIESDKTSFAELVSEFDLLTGMGYDRFAVRQQKFQERRAAHIHTRDGRRVPYRFEPGSSGPFGDDVTEPWATREEALERYSKIFRRYYRLMGDGTFLARGYRWQLLKALEGVIHVPLPGWYDTHATTAAMVEL